MSVPLFHTAPLSVAIFFCPSDNLELAAILSRQVQMHRGRVGQNTKEDVIGNLLTMTIRLMGSLILFTKYSSKQGPDVYSRIMGKQVFHRHAGTRC